MFSLGRRGMTPAGFAHSEIHGSSGYVLLTVAYRSLSRPSSASCAKASTVCPYHLLLDGSVHTYTPAASRSPVRSDAIFLKKKISSLSRYAALKVRRGRALETGHCALSRGERLPADPTGRRPQIRFLFSQERLFSLERR